MKSNYRLYGGVRYVYYIGIDAHVSLCYVEKIPSWRARVPVSIKDICRVREGRCGLLVHIYIYTHTHIIYYYYFTYIRISHTPFLWRHPRGSKNNIPYLHFVVVVDRRRSRSRTHTFTIYNDLWKIIRVQRPERGSPVTIYVYIYICMCLKTLLFCFASISILRVLYKMLFATRRWGVFKTSASVGVTHLLRFSGQNGCMRKGFSEQNALLKRHSHSTREQR